MKKVFLLSFATLLIAVFSVSCGSKNNFPSNEELKAIEITKENAEEILALYEDIVNAYADYEINENSSEEDILECKELHRKEEILFKNFNSVGKKVLTSEQRETLMKLCWKHSSVRESRRKFM